MSEGHFGWPDGCRIAVAVTVMLETWSEGKAPPYSVQASPLRPGTVDLGGIAWGSYGGKVGVWRLINLMRENGIRATFCVNGRCAELYPEAVAQIPAAGHDVAGHGYLQDELMAYMTPDEERATIRRCRDLLARTSGMRPVGWISPVTAFTPHTRALLAAEGFAWHGDSRDTDLPNLAATENGPIVHIPGSDFTDNRVLRASPLDLWDVYKETFGYRYVREAPAFLPLSLHCHFGGRPMISAIFQKIFRYMAQFPDVWFASHAQIAAWVAENKFTPDPRRLLKAASCP